jgi:hypothetical protein
MDMIKLMNCAQKSTATYCIQNCAFILLRSSKHSLKFTLFICEAHFLKDLTNCLLIISLQKVLF